MSLIASSSELSSVNSEQIKQKALALGFHKVGIAAVEAEGRGQEAEGRGQEAEGREQEAEGRSNIEPQRHKDTKNSSPSTHPPIYPSTHPPIHPSTHPPIHPSTHSPHPLQTWLDRGYHADMDWMENPQRQDVRSLMPTVQSVICVALNYYTGHDRPEGSEYAKISRYGWGRDYHRILHKRLKALARWLEEQGEGISVRYYADTGPIQDKVWAERAGMGWIAKNSNVITREYGSWVFLGELLTNLKLMPDRPHTQHCGTCTRCIDACPTQAITQPFVVDANRCIAYHTIENRGVIPEPIAANLQGWIAGCDICQDVCPWNQRFAQATDVAEFQPYPWNIAPTLEEIATLSDAAWQERFPASALRRIKPNMLRRNARLNSLAQMRTECVSIDTKLDKTLEAF